jgi:hypothetical protein
MPPNIHHWLNSFFHLILQDVIYTKHHKKKEENKNKTGLLVISERKNPPKMDFLLNVVKSIGHATCGVLYLGTSLLLEGVEGVARLLGGTVAFLTRATITLPPVSIQKYSYINKVFKGTVQQDGSGRN